MLVQDRFDRRLDRGADLIPGRARQCVQRSFSRGADKFRFGRFVRNVSRVIVCGAGEHLGQFGPKGKERLPGLPWIRAGWPVHG